MRRIVFECKLLKQDGERSVDTLFRIKSRGLPRDKLEDWGYDPPSTTEPDSDAIPQITPRPPSETKIYRGKKSHHLYRAVWLTLLDIDASKSDCDRPDYIYRTTKEQKARLEVLCKQHHFQRYGTTINLHNLTGKTLHQALRNQIRDKKEPQSFANLWSRGSGSLQPQSLQEFKAGYDARCQAENALFEAEDHTTQGEGASRTSSSHETTVSEVTGSPGGSSDASPTSRPDPPRPRAPLSDTDPVAQGSKRKSSTLFTAASRKSPRVAHSGRQQPARSPDYLSDAECSDSADTALALIAPEALTGRHVTEEFESIYELQRKEVLWMIHHLRLENKGAVALTAEPNHLLKSLYERCWGVDWRAGGDKLLSAGRRNLVDDSMTLISAFLFEHVLTPKRLWQVNHDGNTDPDPPVTSPS